MMQHDRGIFNTSNFIKQCLMNSQVSIKNFFRKLIKSTILLFPLLGVTYGMFIWLPKNPKTFISKIYVYINIFFQTTQGIWVAVVYCFCNEEVIFIKSIL
jgi:hypothetical protein